MAGTGPAPAEQRRRRNKDTYADVQTTVKRTSDKIRGPELVAAVGALLEWCEDDEKFPGVYDAVQVWWETWRNAPQAAAFVDTDWQRLAMLAPLVASYYARPHYTKLAEIRQSESLLGATHVDRLRARIKVEPEPSPMVPVGVSVLDEYRDRIAG